jgi:hypothetical protein
MVELIPWQASDWVNRGGELLARDPRLAQRLIQQGLREIPEEAIPYFNLGIALHQQKHIGAAIRAYRQSLALANAPFLEASNNLAQDLLLAGAFAEGWELYERRLQTAKHDNSYFEALAGPAWQGFGDPRPMGELILLAEQGFGDTLQFCRLALALEKQGVAITLFCQPALVAFLQAGSALRHVTDQIDSEAITPATRWCPLMSLPHRLGIVSSNIPFSHSYLKADPDRVAQWGFQLGRRAGHRLVALHWQGNPNHEGSLYSRGRSMRFEQWLPLADVPGVEFVSIQKGAGSEQVRPGAGLPLVAGQAAFDASLDFRDTAAVLANCDLLISADSGVVHLAAALGIPTWVALRWIPEWRWLIHGERSAWYDSVRLFRQPSDNNWAPVVQKITEELAA